MSTTETTAAPVKKMSKDQKRVARFKSIKASLPREMGKVEKIVRLAKRGFSQKEIIQLGKFNKNTVYRQVREQVLA